MRSARRVRLGHGDGSHRRTFEGAHRNAERLGSVRLLHDRTAVLREVLRNGWHDLAYVTGHTMGFDELAMIVDDYPPERVEDICDVPAADVRSAARLLGTCDRLLSTVLQGFYQSNQATAASVQVN